MKKILLILIGTIVLFFIFFCLGLCSPYNYFSAKRDINNKIIRKVCVNEHPVWLGTEQEVGAKYGIDVKCVYTWRNYKPMNIIGINIYNSLMTKALKEKIGIISFNEYLRELDSLRMIIIVR